MRVFRVWGLVFLALLIVPVVAAQVFISEIMYDPLAENGGNTNGEWIEIYNNASEPVNLTHFRICGEKLLPGYINQSSGITEQVEDMILGPFNSSIITDGGTGTQVYNNLTVNLSSLALHVDASSICGGLNNAGEKINLTNTTTIIDDIFDEFTYTDTAQQGFTLERVNFNFLNFRESREINGTPGNPNSVSDITPPIIAYTTPTPNDGANQSSSSITINVTVNDASFNNDTVTITLDSQVIPEVYSFNFINTTFFNVADGIHMYNATANDSGGNTISLVTRVLTVDTNPPNATFVTQPGNYSSDIIINISSEDSTLSVDAVRFNVTQEDEVLVLLSSSQEIYYNATLSIADGYYTILALANDTVDNLNNTESINVTIDTVAPNVTYNTLEGPASNTLILNVTSEDRHLSVDSVRFNLSNSEIGQILLIDASLDTLYHNASLDTTTLAEGTYSISTIANDTVNNINDTEILSITVDNTPPLVNFTSSPGVVSSVYITNTSVEDATAIDSVFFNVSDNTGERQLLTPTLESNHYKASFDTTTVEDGTYTITVFANDSLNNVNYTESLSITVDNTPPAVFFNTSFTNTTSSILLNVTAIDQNSISQVRYNVTNSTGFIFRFNATQESDTFNITFPDSLEDDVYTVFADVNDTLGNRNDTEFIIISLDRKAPNITIESPGNETIVNQNVNFNATVLDATLSPDTVFIEISNGSEIVKFPTTKFLNNYNNTIDTTQLEDGNHTASVFANDTVNNVERSTIILTTDNTGPEIVAITLEPTPLFNNNAATINITSFDIVTAVNTILVEGNWTGTPTNFTASALNSTLFNITIDANDLQNNESIDITVYAVDTTGSRSTTTAYFEVQNREPERIDNLTNISFKEDVFQKEVFNLSAIFSDADGDTLGYTATHTDNLTISISNTTGLVNITPQSNFFGNQTVIFSAHDGFGGSASSQNITITVNASNENPIKTSDINDISFLEDEASAIFQLSDFFTDSDGDTLTFGISSISNNGITPQVNPTTGKTFINASLDFNGQGTVVFSATDPSGAPGVSNVVTVTVTAVNDIPTINSSIDNATITKQEDDAAFIVTLTEFEIDVDGETGEQLNWSVINFNESLLNAEITNNATDELTITPLPDANGIDNITLQLTDSTNLSARANLTIIINATNDLPVISQTIPNQVTNDSASNTLDIDLQNFINDDKDSGTISLSTTGQNNAYYTRISQVSGTKIISIIVKENIAKAATIQDTFSIVATDEDSTTASQQITLTINPVNDAPSTPAPTNPENDSVAISPTVTLKWNASEDVDGDAITYHLFFGMNATNTTSNGSTTALQKSIPTIDNTTYFWYILANDGSLNSTPSDVFNFTTRFNNAPNIVNFTPSTTTFNQIANTTILFTIHSDDVDGDQLTTNFTIGNTELQTNTTAPDTTILFSYTADDLGTKTLVSSITDGNNTVSQSWSITVTRSNTGPTFSPISAQTLTEDIAFALEIAADDPNIPEGDSLNFTSNDSRISIIKVNASNSRLSFTPSDSDTGNFTAIITVNDELEQKATQNIIFIVQNINDAPNINSISPSNTQTVLVGSTQTQRFNVTTSDDDGDTLTFAWIANGSKKSATDTFTLLANDFGPGTFPVIVTVGDGFVNITRQWTVKITDGPESPVLDISFDGPSQTATNVVFSTSAGSIQYGNQQVDLSNVINIDNGVIISANLIAVDSSLFPPLNKQANITINNAGTNTIILQSSAFASNKNQITAPCKTCSEVSNTAGKLNFITSSFSSFTTIDNATAFTLSAPSSITVDIDQASTTFIVSNTGTQNVNNVVLTAPANTSIEVSADGTTFGSSTTPVTISNGATQKYHVRTTSNTTGVLGDLSISSTEASPLTVSITAVAPSKLQFKEVEVDHSGKDRTVLDGDRVRNVDAGQTIKITVDMENLFTDEENIEIQDVDVEGEIKDIDDGDDVTDDDVIDEIKPEDNEKVKLEFSIPDETKEDSYDVIITVSARDERGTKYNLKREFTLEVEREEHDIRLERVELTPIVLSCSRSLEVSATMKNFGRDNENDAAIQIRGPGFSDKRIDIELSDDSFDDESEYDYSKTFRLDKDLEAGEYTIDFIALRDETKEESRKSEKITVNDCRTAQETATVQQTSTFAPQQLPPVVITNPPEAVTIKTERNDSLILGAGIIVILLLLLIVLLLALAAKKKRY